MYLHGDPKRCFDIRQERQHLSIDTGSAAADAARGGKDGPGETNPRAVGSESRPGQEVPRRKVCAAHR